MLGKKEEKVSEVEAKAGAAKMPPAAVEAKTKEGKVAQAPVNELVFRPGMELEFEKLPFEVLEVTGNKLVLKRKDIV